MGYDSPMPKDLLHGFALFRANYFAKERELLEELARGQNPGVLFVGCSDSRVVPELITQSGPGELFVLRNVANAVPPSGSFDSSSGAAVEFAVQVLRVKHAVVCGHTSCGGAEAAFVRDRNLLGPMPALRQWLAFVEPAANRVRASGKTGADALDAVVRENVLGQLNNLLSYPCVRAAVEAGQLALHGWVYDVRGASLSIYDPEQDAFVAAPAPEVSAPAGSGEPAPAAAAPERPEEEAALAAPEDPAGCGSPGAAEEPA